MFVCFRLQKCCFLRLQSFLHLLYFAYFCRENSDSTPCQQKVLFVNICHLHWLSSARGSAREYSCNSFVFVYCPEYSGLLRFPLRSLPVTLVHPVLPFPFLLAVLLCGVPEMLVAFWGALCGSVRESFLAFTPYTLHLTPQLCCLSPPLTSKQ